MRVIEIFPFAYVDEIIDIILWFNRSDILKPGLNLLLWLHASIEEPDPLEFYSQAPGRMAVERWLRVYRGAYGLGR